jgi:hypothetical protein
MDMSNLPWATMNSRMSLERSYNVLVGYWAFVFGSLHLVFLLCFEVREIKS